MGTKDAPAATLGIGSGGAVVDACRKEYLKAVKELVRLASLQTAFVTLDMEEQSREEFFRVKKVVEKKKAKLAREKLEEEALAATKTEAKTAKANGNAFDAPSALPPKKDADIVF